MNSAKFKTLREAIGLSVTDLATIASVQPRTARYWESGRNVPPEEVSKSLVSIDVMLSHSVEQAIKLYQDKNPDEILLYRYVNAEELHKAHPEFKGLPVSTHAAMLYRVSKRFEEMGVPVSIEYKQ